MKRLVVLVGLVGAMLLASSTTIFAKGNGVTMSDVIARGWTCFPSDYMWHCVHPNTDLNALFTGQLASVPVYTFANPDGERFLGTEILIRADLGSDSRPCPAGYPLQDGTFEARDFGGAPGPEYYACHHNNNP